MLLLSTKILNAILLMAATCLDFLHITFNAQRTKIELFPDIGKVPWSGQISGGMFPS
jgi:hypothetical protein